MKKHKYANYQIYKRSESGNYQMDFSIPGSGRSRVSLKTGNLNTAKLIAAEVYENALKESYGIKVDMTIADALETFLDYSRKEKSSYKADLARARNILEFLQDKKLSSLTKSDLFALNDYLKTKKLHKQWTRNHTFALLRAAINLAIENGDIEKSPVSFKGVIKKLPGEEGAFTIDEIQKILDYSQKVQEGAETKSQYYFYPFLVIAFNTGMRAGEILNLRWGDIKQSEIIIREKNNIKKGGRIPLLPYLNDYIHSLPKDSFYVLNTNQRRSDTFRKLWLKMKFELQLPKKSKLHWTRHSVITFLMTQNVPVNIVMAIARHSNLSTTQRYTHSDFEKMAESMEKLEIITKIKG